MVILLQMVPPLFLSCYKFAYLELWFGRLCRYGNECSVPFEGKLVCTGSDDASLRIWDPKSAQIKHVVRGNWHQCCNNHIMILYVLSQPQAWNLSDVHLSIIVGHGYHTDGLTCLSITLDSQTVVSGSKDNSVHVVNVNSGKVGVAFNSS